MKTAPPLHTTIACCTPSTPHAQPPTPHCTARWQQHYLLLAPSNNHHTPLPVPRHTHTPYTPQLLPHRWHGKATGKTAVSSNPAPHDTSVRSVPHSWPRRGDQHQYNKHCHLSTTPPWLSSPTTGWTGCCIATQAQSGWHHVSAHDTCATAH
jgi:hypothetical protein